MERTDDFTINTELFDKMDADTTSSTVNIFKMGNDELYDDEEYDGEEYEARPRKKVNKIIVVLILACLLALLGIGGVTFGIVQASKVKGIQTQLEEAQKTVTETNTIITQLNETIALKDQEIETLKNQGAAKPATTTDDKGNTATAAGTTTTTGGLGKHGSTYTVTNERGMNIRAEANSNAEVVASLAYGDDFVQYGDVITDSEGNLWVEMMWDDGYGCIQLADGTSLAKLS